MRRPQDSLNDLVAPESVAAFQQTIQDVPQSPAEFKVAKAGTVPDAAVFTVTDQIGPARRLATVSYRIYYTPLLTSALKDMGSPLMRQGILQAGIFVTSVESQANGAPISVTKPEFAGKKGWFTCVGVNRLNMESSPLNIHPSPWN